MHFVTFLGDLWQMCCGGWLWDVRILKVDGGGVAMLKCSRAGDLYGVTMHVVDGIGVVVLR